MTYDVSSRGMEYLGAKGVKAGIRFLEYLLSDGQVHQGGIDVFMAEIGREVMEAGLRIDPGAIPGQHPMDDKRVPQIMEPRSGTPCGRLQVCQSDHLGQQMPEGAQLVALAFVLVPKQCCGGGLDGVALRTGMEIIPQHSDETWPEWELARLEVLGIAHGERGLLEVEIAQGETDEFA